MERKIRLMAFIVMFTCIGMLTAAQQPGPAFDKPPADELGLPEIQQGQTGRMEGPPRGMGMKKHDPEREKRMQRNNSLLMMAEAHKGLAQLYEDQNKLDEAAAELYKIIELARENMPKNTDEPFFKRNIMGKIMPVYHHISQLYIKNNRAADAEKLLLEGIAMFEKDNPGDAAKLTMLLAEMYKNNNDLKKAEETYKRIIELNQKSLKE